MKYLAILKDCLLEALDTKVFYAMLGLSFLVILLAASVSYHPVTFEDEVRKDVGTMSWMFGLMGREQYPDGPPALRVAEFTQTNADAPPWEGNYRFDVVVEFKNEQGPKKRGPAGQIVPMALRQSFPYLDNVRVKEVEAPDDKSVQYEVTTRGTRIKNLGEWPHEPTILFAVPLPFWHAPVGDFVRFFESTLVGFFGGAISLLLSAIITAFFIPNMLRKGTVDMLVVKPIHRTTLLIYKYIGGLAFIFLNTTFVVFGIWLVLGLRTGMWGPGFLTSILIITFQFALYYAVSTLFGVLTRSPIVAILAACLAWLVIGLFAGYGYFLIDQTRVARRAPELQEDFKLEDDGKPPEPPNAPRQLLADWVYTTADIIHFVTPRVKDLDVLSGKLIADDTLPSYSKERKAADKLYASFSWTEAITVTLVYIIVLLAISCWWFATKDY